MPKNITPELEIRWQKLCKDLNIHPHKKAFIDIVSRYNESHRKYHNLNHIYSCFKELDAITHLLFNPQAVELAIWYHDAVYTIGKNDNEEQSTKLAKKFCQNANLSANFTKQVENHILATKHVLPTDNIESQYTADIDLSILGKPMDIFNKTGEKIYQEYSTLYSLSEYQKGRINFFETILKHPIYQTDYFKQKYESKAKKNITIAIGQLRHAIASN